MKQYDKTELVFTLVLTAASLGLAWYAGGFEGFVVLSLVSLVTAAIGAGFDKRAELAAHAADFETLNEAIDDLREKIVQLEDKQRNEEWTA